MTNAQPIGWSDDIRLTFNDARSLDPAIAVEGNNVHVVYADDEGGGYLDMFLWYIFSNDNGDTWNLPICLVNGPPIRILGPKIAVNGSNIHVIWLEYNSKILYYIRSLDNGKTWSTVVTLTSNVCHNQINWDIGVYKNNLYIVYINQDYKLSYLESNNNGITWSSPRVLVPSNSRVIESAIAVNGNNIHIAFRDTRDRMGNIISEIFYLRSIDGGVNWNSDINIAVIPGVDILCDFPDIGVTGNDIFVVYRGQSPESRQIYLSYSKDNGIIWEKGIRLSNSTKSVVVPAIASENSNVYVVWEDSRASGGGWELYYKSSHDGGIIWGEDTRLTIAPESSDSMDIVINDNNVYIVWSDRRDSNREIYYKHMKLPSPQISAVIDIDPNTLNLKSKGRWITAYIELIDNYNVHDINISSILLENIIPCEDHPIEIGDYDNDNISDLMVKFDRTLLEDYINIHNNSISFKITGNLETNKCFEGSDIIQIIKPP